MISPSSTLSHGHRRQLSTPAPFEAAQPPVMSAMPPRRTHRRGQTVDYGSFSSQIPAVDRRNASNKVAQLRDFFNEKSGYSRPVSAAQQFPPSLQQDGQSMMSLGLPTLHEGQYQTSYMWNPEELQDIYAGPGNTASFPTPTAPILSRSASDNPDPNAPLKNAMYRMRQERQQRDLKRWESISQQPLMIPKEQTTIYEHSIHQHPVQPEGISPKENPYLSCKSRTCSLKLDGLLTSTWLRHFSPYTGVNSIEEFF